MKLIILFSLISVSYCQNISPNFPLNNSDKKSYVCPPNFIRQGHRCYYYSRQPVSWQDALFQCQDMHSNLAIIQNRNQDKLIRNFLSRKTLDPLERWIGGVYDWGKMSWKWAASGKPLTFKGFPKETPATDVETLRWHCIILDPSLNYTWSSRTCFEQKHFICQTRLKTVTNRDKKKLQRHYKANKDNKLNEIPVPLMPDVVDNTTTLKYKIPVTYKFELNEKLNNQALFAYKSPELHKKIKINSRTNRKRNPQKMRLGRRRNGTMVEVPKRRINKRVENIRRPNFSSNLRWKTYQEHKKLANPLYPQPIVEEYHYIQEG